MTENIIHELKLIIKELFPEFEGIYFYGSRMKGNSTTYSDYDFALIFNRKVDRKFRDKIIEAIYELELKYDVLLDVKVYSSNDIQNPITPFRSNIKTEGVFYGV
ncbi:MAG: nucleotidyltransferase domain-containing protein [bacterium]